MDIAGVAQSHRRYLVSCDTSRHTSAKSGRFMNDRSSSTDLRLDIFWLLTLLKLAFPRYSRALVIASMPCQKFFGFAVEDKTSKSSIEFHWQSLLDQATRSLQFAQTSKWLRWGWRNSITAHHFRIVTDLAWLALNTHQTTILVLAPHVGHPYVRLHRTEQCQLE